MLCTSIVLIATVGAAAPSGAGWEQVTTRSGVQVFRRDHAGTSLQEVRAVGRVNAVVEQIAEVVDDVRIFERIIPFMTTSEVLSRDGASTISHHVISLPTVAPRDVVVKLSRKETTLPDGRTALDVSFASVDGGPAPADGIVRVASLAGRARVVARRGGGADVEFNLYVEPGGRLPAMLVNMATQRAAPTVLVNLSTVAASR